MFSSLSDSVPAMKSCQHFESPEDLMKVFEDDVYSHLKQVHVDNNIYHYSYPILLCHTHIY